MVILLWKAGHREAIDRGQSKGFHADTAMWAADNIHLAILDLTSVVRTPMYTEEYLLPNSSSINVAQPNGVRHFIEREVVKNRKRFIQCPSNAPESSPFDDL